MVKVTKREFDNLKKAGLIKDGGKGMDKNYRVANREHISRNKRYYVSETYPIVKFLGLLENNRNGNQNNNRKR